MKKNILFYFFILSFVFVSTFTLTISWGLQNPTRFFQRESVLAKTDSKEDLLEISPIPVFKDDGVLMSELTAQSVLAVDLDSGGILFEKDPFKPLLPASTTKIVTALVAMDYYPLSQILSVGKVTVDGQKMHLVPLEKITVENLMYGLLVASANDAAEVLAQNYQGGRQVFIEKMNRKIKNLGLKNTHFVNPSGLDEEGQVTTAIDLLKIANYAMENPFFRKVVATKEIVVESIDAHEKHRLTNINQLVGEVDGVLGVKTGWTENARENLVTYLERDGRRLMIVVLSSTDRFGETKALINWIFENYAWK